MEILSEGHPVACFTVHASLHATMSCVGTLLYMKMDATAKELLSFLDLPPTGVEFEEFAGLTQAIELDFPGRGLAEHVQRELLERPDIPDGVLLELFRTWQPAPAVLALLKCRQRSPLVLGSFLWSVIRNVDCTPDELEEHVPATLQEFFFRVLQRDPHSDLDSSHPEEWFASAGLLGTESQPVQEIAVGLVANWEGAPAELVEAARQLVA